MNTEGNDDQVTIEIWDCMYILINTQKYSIDFKPVRLEIINSITHLVNYLYLYSVICYNRSFKPVNSIELQLVEVTV